jgi:hypothetical protein
MSDTPAPPEPPVANLLRVQAIFQGGSNLPQDKYVNTWHFRKPATVDFATAAPLASDRVSRFYTVAATPSTSAVGAWFSGSVNRNFELRTYDLAIEANTRVPVIRSGVLPSVLTGSWLALPTEVALCMSFKGVGAFNPRTSGRLYLGPLHTGALNTIGGQVVNDANFRDSIMNAAARVVTETEALHADWDWVVYSRMNDLAVRIATVWVDNTFDTMRKRGPKATSRVSVSV